MCHIWGDMTYYCPPVPDFGGRVPRGIYAPGWKWTRLSLVHASCLLCADEGEDGVDVIVRVTPQSVYTVQARTAMRWFDC